MSSTCERCGLTSAHTLACLMEQLAIERNTIAEQQAEIDRLRAERAEARSFIRSTYDQFEKHHPYAHELRTRYPWLEDAVANVKLLQLAEQHPAPQEWYDEAKGETDAAR